MQAHSQVCIRGEGVFFGQKWTFLRDISEKMNFFVCFLGKSGPFSMLFWGKWTSPRVYRMSGASSLGKSWKIWLKIMHLETLWSNHIPFQIVNNKTCPKLRTFLDTSDQNYGQFWTLLDHGGLLSYPLHSNWMRACTHCILSDPSFWKAYKMSDSQN